MYERKELLSMISSLYKEIRSFNGYRVKPSNIKRVINSVSRIRVAIQSSSLPKEERSLYESMISKALARNSYNLKGMDERSAKLVVKDFCACIDEIVTSLERKV